MKSKKISTYDAEEQKLRTQSATIVEYLKKTGRIEDSQIQDPEERKAQQQKARRDYHNIGTAFKLEVSQSIFQRYMS